jgi:hypothetical protein
MTMQVANVHQARVDAYSSAIPQNQPKPDTPARQAFATYQPPSPLEMRQERAKRDTPSQTIELKDVAERGTLRDSVRNSLTGLGNEIKKDPGKYTKIEMDGCYKRVKEGAERSAVAAENFLETYLEGAGVRKDIETGAKRCGRGKDDFRSKHNVEVRIHTNLA